MSGVAAPQGQQPQPQGPQPQPQPRSYEFAVPAEAWDPRAVRLREPPQPDRRDRAARFLPLVYGDGTVECPAVQVLTPAVPAPVFGEAAVARVALAAAAPALAAKLAALYEWLDAALTLRHGVLTRHAAFPPVDVLHVRVAEGVKALDARTGEAWALRDARLARRPWRLVVRVAGVSLPATGGWVLEWRLAGAYVL